MRIRTANSLIAVLYLTLSMAGVVALHRFGLERQGEAVAYQRQREAIDQLGRFLGGFKQLTTCVQSYAATGEPRFAQDYWRELEVTRSRERATQALFDLRLTGDERDLINEAKSHSDALIKVEDRAIQAARAGDRDRALQLVFGPAYQRDLRGIFDLTLQLKQKLEARLQEALEHSRQAAASWWRLSVALALLNMLMVVIVLVVIYPRVISSPLVRLQQRMQALLAGEHPTPQPLGPAAREIRELATSLEAFQAKAEQLDRDQWAKAQQVRITAGLQRLHDSAELARYFLAQLVALMGIGSATFYRRVPDAERLQLVGSYALTKPEAVPVEIPFGDGLVGEVARQGEPIHLEDPPAHYLTIGSGTGSAPAAEVHVLPVCSAERLLAVIELASFHPLPPHQLSLLSDLLPLLALALEALPGAACPLPSPQPQPAAPLSP